MKSDLLLEGLLENKIISNEDAEIYRFGMECLFLKVVNYLSYIVIAVILNMVPELFLMAFAVIPLRRNAGGYHAKTRMGCYLFSCVVLLVALWMCKHLSIYEVWYMLAGASNLIILRLAPLDNKSKRLDNMEKQYFCKRTKIILIVIDFVCVLAILLKENLIIKAMITGMCISALLLIICKKERQVKV